MVEKHSWVGIPAGWRHEAAAPASHVFNIKIGLKQQGIEELIENLMEISDPTHVRYAQHLSREEANAFMAPHPDSIVAVDEWLEFHGIDPSSAQRSRAGDWITVTVSVEQAEKMLGTKYDVYKHGSSGERVVRTLSYSLPQQLHAHIDVVSPTTYFSTLKTMQDINTLETDRRPLNDEVTRALPGTAAAVPSTCNTMITPTCLRDLYNTSSYVPAAVGSNQIGIAGYLDQFANFADLQTFFKAFRKDAVGSSFTIIQVNGGGNDQTDPGVQANTDIQYSTGIVFPTQNIFYSTGGSPPFTPDSQNPTNLNSPYLDLLTFLLGQETVPQTLLTSYGDDEQTVPFDYATKVCQILATFGSLGTTVVFTSGGSGVGAGSCKTNDGTNRVQFQPVFPASCPFVTAVGATTSVNPEVAFRSSGGGFSNYFSTPSYQKGAVSSFLANLGSINAGLFNKSGRAYPDVAAQGQGLQVIISGRTNSVSGTSAASSTVAGIFSLLNDFRISQHQSALGFINPLIYSTASSGFNDITTGSNPGCGTAGFSAGVGWDPVTGLGTPNFLALQGLV
ncbi:subtilisin-like protein [Agrocybe pediades]|nr:subtilisin-like protein [Agrocybe pediades]